MRVVGAKLAIALALAVPDSRQPVVNYWLVDAALGLEAGASVAMSGIIVGRVVATREHGDTTFLKVQFTADTRSLSRSRMLLVQREGAEGMVVVETASGQGGASVKRGGRVRVIFQDPPIEGGGADGGRPSEETRPPYLWHPLPPSPAAPRLAPLRST